MNKKTNSDSKAFERGTPKTADQTTESAPNIHRIRSLQRARSEQPEQSEQSGQIERPTKVKPLQVLETATNPDGEVFKPGDKIRVSAPWGGGATAEIVSLYQDDSGNAWAKYTPNESRANWNWEGGCVRAMRLIKA